MQRVRLLRLTAVAIALPVALGTPGIAQAAPFGSEVSAPASAAERVDPVLHRVVWDAAVRKGPGTKVVSANLDGSDRKVVYKRAKGWILDLTLNRAGTAVAMAPFQMRGGGHLVVADVLGGGHKDLLADTRRIDYVGGIGWSPDGRRLVFEGVVGRGEARAMYLWTIRRNGTGLTRLTRVERGRDGEGPGRNRVLAWTPRGIYYSDGRGHLLRLKRGRTHLVVPRASNPAISGNGRWLFIERTGRDDDVSLWRIRPDGTRLQRVIRRTRPHPTMGYLTSAMPDYSGNQLLTVAWGDMEVGSGPLNIIHGSSRAPRMADERLEFTSGAST